jgi:hypothetical protein
MDENALIRDTRNAEQAQRILENEAFLSVVEQIKDRIWKKLPGAPVETLPVLKMELNVLNDIVSLLRYSVQTGKLSQVQLNRLHDRERAA